MTDVPGRVVECFRIVFPYLTPEEARLATRQSLDNWDSLASISLLTVVEEEFDVQFDDDDIDLMTSFASVCDAVIRRAGV